MAKGALTNDHVLIVPIAHTSNTGELQKQQLAEIEQYKVRERESFFFFFFFFFLLFFSHLFLVLFFPLLLLRIAVLSSSNVFC
jgi:hypothetical protein